MPQPKLVNARVLWDRVRVEAFFEALPERDSPGSGPEEDPWATWKP
ncbi:hypothetical protein [uncultured Methylobacterium sp.]|jgi:hypothetical protein